MVRDEEINRLTKYAEGLGLKVTFSPTLNDAAQWVLDGSEIIISTKKNISKMETVLSMIHEIGHQVWFIHEKHRHPDLKFEEAIDRQNLFETEYLDTPAPKKLRHKIYKAELDAAEWWEIIYKDTGCSFPLWRLQAAKDYDLFQYRVYYETGHFPNRAEKHKKNKEINLKYKSKKDII